MGALGAPGVRYAAWVALTVALGGCRPDVHGPTPRIDGISPTLDCARNGQPVEVHGDGFSPMITGAFGGWEGFGYSVPLLFIELTADLDGTPVAPRVVTLDLRPADTQPDASVGLQSALWHSQQLLSFVPDTDAWGLWGLGGVYKLTVLNPDGRKAVAASSLTLVPSARVDSLQPSSVSAAAESSVTLVGDYFVRVGGLTPTVSVGGSTVPLASLDGCRTLAALDGEACTSATVIVASGTLAAGRWQIEIVGPEPLPCVNDNPSLRLTVR